LAWEAPNVRAPRPKGRRLKIGITSSYLFDHSIGHTSRGFVEEFNRDLFEVTVIRLAPSPGHSIAKAIDAAADTVVTITAGGGRARSNRISVP